MEDYLKYKSVEQFLIIEHIIFPQRLFYQSRKVTIIGKFFKYQWFASIRMENYGTILIYSSFVTGHCEKCNLKKIHM